MSRIWATDGTPRHAPGTRVERVLPNGAAHLVIRLESEPLRLLDAAGERVEAELGSAVLGGVRSRAYLKDVERPVASVGAVLEPGAVLALAGVPASELAERHAPLDALWGRAADRIADVLASLPDDATRLDRFERELAERLPRARGLHPGVARALSGSRVGESRAGSLAERAGLGPRRFGELFREAVGVSPKRWLRLRRFQRVLARAADPALDWAGLAAELGYADQPHLVREFRELAGLTPSAYRRLAPRAPNHVPIERPSARAPFSPRRR